MMAYRFILTCEHAGNIVPAEYEHLFKGHEEVLYSHKGIDFGALRLAKHLAAATDLPLFFTTISRLLIDANRSLDKDDLFSEYSKKLTAKERKILVGKHYFPHRKKVEKRITKLVAAGNKVIHLALHTFTPVLDGEVRQADIGILFDPERALETTFASRLKAALQTQQQDREVLYNSPYPGTADGLPAYLREKFGDDDYAGFELEINQKFFLNGEPDIWKKLVTDVTAALQAVLTGR